MTVAAAGVAVVQRDINISAVTAKDAEPLTFEQDRARRLRARDGQQGPRQEQRAPPEIGTAEFRRWVITLDLRCRHCPTGSDARDIVAIEASEHRGQPRILMPSEAQLAQLRESPLADRDGVLRIAACWEREIGQGACERGREAIREALHERRDERFREPELEALGELHSIPESAMGEEVVVL